MHLTRMRFGGVPPFTEPVDFKFDERVNVFIGSNATGKSTLINVLIESIFDSNPWHDELGIIASEDWPSINNHSFDRRGQLAKDWNRLPFIKIGATRIGLPRIAYLSGYEAPKMPSVDGKTLNDIFGNYHDDVFYGSNVEIAAKLLTDRASYFPCLIKSGKARLELAKAMKISFLCAKDINREVVTGTQLLNIVEEFGNLENNLLATPPDVRIGMSVETVDGDSLPMHSLSSGTQGPLLWVRFLALQMLHHYEFVNGWEKKPAILLIDEIENHLHPTWQRRVIPALLEHFSGLQIFATTHSPFVVAGLKAGQVHLLDRDPATGVVTASTNDRDIIGWTADEILRAMMGVDEPTDQLTVDRANRLRQLREKETLTPEEESELNALRRQVNEDLLARGGPLEVERERYADLMMEFLRSQQSELTQDGE